MNSSSTRIATLTLLAVILVAGTYVSAQKCGCAPNLCCSEWGYCGTGNDYCGPGCQSGPCDDPGDPAVVANIVTESFFESILDQSASNCEGRGFYTRDAFLQAAASYPFFGTSSNDAIARREIAAFFAHVTHETGFFCYIEEQGGSTRNYCDSTSTQWPCNPNRGYYGRGPIQLSWNYNYGAAGVSIGFDGLNNPDIVASDNVISFRTALWFWMNNNVHNIMVSGQGFGETIKAINSMECGGGNPATVANRVQYYTNYCAQFGVDPGTNLSC